MSDDAPPAEPGRPGSPAIHDLIASIASIAATLESYAERSDLTVRQIAELQDARDSMKHTLDDPANPENLRDRTTRQGARLDGVEREVADLRRGRRDAPWWDRGIDAVMEAYRGLPKNVRVAVWLMAALAVLLYFGVPQWLGPAATAERQAVREAQERRERRAFVLDSLRLVKLEALARQNAAGVDSLGTVLDSLTDAP